MLEFHWSFNYYTLTSWEELNSLLTPVSCFLSSSRPEDERAGQRRRWHSGRRGQRGRPGGGGGGGERGGGERIGQSGEWCHTRVSDVIHEICYS